MSAIRKCVKDEVLELLREHGPQTSGQLFVRIELATNRQQVYQAVYDLRSAGHIDTCDGVHSRKNGRHVQDVQAIDDDDLDESGFAHNTTSQNIPQTPDDIRAMMRGEKTERRNSQHLQPQPPATPFRCAITSDACLLLQGATINENGFVELNAEQTNTLFAYLDRTLKLSEEHS